jgi:hypothetical protein
MTVKYYKPESDTLEELTQKEFDKIENVGILDSKRLSVINIISNMSREEFKEVFTSITILNGKSGLYELIYKYRKEPKTWL